MTIVKDQITIERPVELVFSTLVELDVLEKLWADVSDVQSPEKKVSRVGQTFVCTKTIHNRSQRQKFQVTAFEPPRLFAIATTLFKLPVIFRYELAAQGNGLTRVSLAKCAELTGWTRVMGPLMRHLFTKPEHDEFHLQRLKKLVELGAEPTAEIV